MTTIMLRGVLAGLVLGAVAAWAAAPGGGGGMPVAVTQRAATEELLRKLEAARTREEISDAAAALGEVEPAARESLEPILLAQMAKEEGMKAYVLAGLLIEWDPGIGVRSKAFARFVPALEVALKRGDAVAADGSEMSEAGAAIMLARLTRETAYPIRQAMFDNFNRPVKKPIEGESEDCWRVAVLAILIEHFGPEGVPALIKGLEHEDRWVRMCAMGGLTGTGEIGDSDDIAEGWKMTRAEVAAVRAAARKALPKMIALLDDKGQGVPEAALKALAVLLVPADATAELKAKLFATHGGGALAALHPAATAELMKVALTEGAENQWARQGVSAIGGPVVGELMTGLREGKMPAGMVSEILNAMDFKWLGALSAASKVEVNEQCRQVLAAAYAKIYADAKWNVTAAVNEMVRAPAEASGQRRGRMMQEIGQIRRCATVGANAVGTLETLAAAEKDEEIKTALQGAIEEIKKVALTPEIAN